MRKVRFKFMNIEERVKKAYDLHHMGYNCAQALLGAYVDF